MAFPVSLDVDNVQPYRFLRCDHHNGFFLAYKTVVVTHYCLFIGPKLMIRASDDYYTDRQIEKDTLSIDNNNSN